MREARRSTQRCATRYHGRQFHTAKASQCQADYRLWSTRNRCHHSPRPIVRGRQNWIAVHSQENQTLQAVGQLRGSLGTNHTGQRGLLFTCCRRHQFQGRRGGGERSNPPPLEKKMQKKRLLEKFLKKKKNRENFRKKTQK